MHVLCIGAHPDDCDLSAGGTAALFARRGDRVKFVSVTNGDRGHMADEYLRDRSALARRREAEGKKAAAVVGGEYESLNVHDGDVYVARELTESMVRTIRSFGEAGKGPDLVLLNRPNDYHRDHRYTSQLVLDAVYMLMVPLLCPETPALKRMPVLAYWFDGFIEGGAFRPSVVVPIDAVTETKARCIAEHESQIFEWLPYVGGQEAPPADAAGRRQFALDRVSRMGKRVAARCREIAPQLMPADCELAEAFQISEYGRRPSDDEIRSLFGVQG